MFTHKVAKDFFVILENEKPFKMGGTVHGFST